MIDTNEEFAKKCTVKTKSLTNYAKIKTYDISVKEVLVPIAITEERLRRDERRFLEILYAKEIESAKLWARRKKRFLDFFKRRKVNGRI